MPLTNANIILALMETTGIEHTPFYEKSFPYLLLRQSKEVHHRASPFGAAQGSALRARNLP
jgi:hypothetical protein